MGEEELEGKKSETESENNSFKSLTVKREEKGGGNLKDMWEFKKEVPKMKIVQACLFLGGDLMKRVGETKVNNCRSYVLHNVGGAGPRGQLKILILFTIRTLGVVLHHIS